MCSVLRYERKTPGCTNGRLRANLGANAERAYVLTPTGNFSIEDNVQWFIQVIQHTEIK